MKAELREVLGKAAYETVTPLMEEAGFPPEKLAWNEADARVQESYRMEAEAVVRALAMQLVPVLHLLLTEDDVKALLAQLV